MAHDGAFLTPGAQLHFGSLDFVFSEPEEPLLGAIFARPEPSIGNCTTACRDPQPEAPRVTTGATSFVFNISGDDLAAILGPSPSQERFCLIAYAITGLALQAEGEEHLPWDEFLDHYNAMYPEEQPDLLPDPAFHPAPAPRPPPRVQPTSKLPTRG